MRSSIFPLAFSLLGLAPVCAQGSYVTYGQGCWSLGEPGARVTLSASGSTRIGGTLTVSFTNPTWQSRNWIVVPTLVTGMSDRTWAGLTLPFGIFHVPVVAPDCMLYCSVDVVVPVGSSRNNRSGSVTLQIPNDPRLIGLRLYQQWFLETITDGTFADGWISFTNGGALTIGA